MRLMLRCVALLFLAGFLLFQGGSPPVSAVVPGLNGDIAFSSDRDGNWDIYVMGADGADVRRLTDDPAVDDLPAWSPDGSRIAFLSARDGTGQVYVMDADGTNETRLSNTSGSSPAWSPDGSEIAFVGNSDGNLDIYVMNADGSNVRRLTTAEGVDQDPDWSPDGSMIVFVSGRDSVSFPKGQVPEIYRMTASGQNQTRLTTNLSFDNSPSWSPDGTRIIFGSNRNGAGDIYAMNADGTSSVRLTDSPHSDILPTWSPDGSRVAFVTYRDGNPELYVMGADGSVPTNITNSPSSSDTSPDWQPLLAGDVNCQGGVNSIDAALVLQHEAGLLTDLPCSDRADVNLDGRTNSQDAALILQFVAGLLPVLPPFN